MSISLQKSFLSAKIQLRTKAVRFIRFRLFVFLRAFEIRLYSNECVRLALRQSTTVDTSTVILNILKCLSMFSPFVTNLCQPEFKNAQFVTTVSCPMWNECVGLALRQSTTVDTSTVILNILKCLSMFSPYVTNLCQPEFKNAQFVT